MLTSNRIPQKTTYRKLSLWTWLRSSTLAIMFQHVPRDITIRVIIETLAIVL